ncbi:MAG: WD40 repeat domain-containing protein, partial [Microbacteriaceae bacterium]|nr:WD40 repeat domain-containing protein [Burkholderiaceae bacterium]
MRNPDDVWKVLRQLGAAAVMAGTALAAAQQPPPVAASAASTASAEVFVQTGNSLMATMVRFSPDSQRVATCDGSGLVMGWDATSGRQYHELHKHTGMCLGLAFTPDGQAVLSSGGARSGNEVVMSRWIDGEVLQSWSGHKGQVLDLAATRDGKGAWSLGDQEVMLRWALGSDKPVQTVPLLVAGESAAGTLYTSAMVLTRDQQKAYVARRDGSVLAVNLAGAAAPVVLARLPESISAIALSPDGAVLALSFGTLMGSTSKDVVLLDAATGREIRRLSGHEGNVFALAFSPDGQLLASAAQIDTRTMLGGSMKAVSQHEALRVWRLPDGAVLADVRNQRNLNGVPFLRGSLDFSPPASRAPGTSGTGQRLALAMWDEAARVYELDAAQVPRLVHTLEGRGLAPRQLQASDRLGQLLVTDGRPRVEPKDVYLQAAQLRSEFGTPADWTPERVQRTDLLYGPRGMRSQVNRASIWNLKSGRLEQVADWQRGTPGDVGLDAQGRFVSIAPLFPNTILFQPLRTYMLRQATLDGQGETKLEHFGYEPWDGPLGALFTTPVAATGTAASTATTTTTTSAGVTATAPALTAGSYRTDIMVQSTGQRFTAVAGIPIGDSKNPGAPLPPPRVLVQERLASGERVPRLDIPVPGLVTAMAISADQATLWLSGTASGVPYDMEHKGWLMAVALADGRVLQRWPLADGITVDVIVAHPVGQMAITNGGTNLSIWDSRQAQRKYFIKASDSLRVVRALAMTADGKRIAAADAAGWTVMWDWPVDGPPEPRWSRTLPAPGAHVLTFLDGGRRLAAGAPDGSVRLLAGQDGGEIARMIRFDTGEWITITPEGYFVASTEGDRWVNVRMNGSVYGIDQFYDVFYRPDLVQRKLAGEDIRPFIRVTLQDALRDPPPSVSVNLPPGAVPPAGQ